MNDHDKRFWRIVNGTSPLHGPDRAFVRNSFRFNERKGNLTPAQIDTIKKRLGDGSSSGSSNPAPKKPDATKMHTIAGQSARADAMVEHVRKGGKLEVSGGKILTPKESNSESSKPENWRRNTPVPEKPKPAPKREVKRQDAQVKKPVVATKSLSKATESPKPKQEEPKKEAISRPEGKEGEWKKAAMKNAKMLPENHKFVPDSKLKPKKALEEKEAKSEGGIKKKKNKKPKGPDVKRARSSASRSKVTPGTSGSASSEFKPMTFDQYANWKKKLETYAKNPKDVKNLKTIADIRRLMAKYGGIDLYLKRLREEDFPNLDFRKARLTP